LKYFIFSDIHSNLEAFETVLTAASGEDYDFVLSLGDLVGYGANPNECIETLNALPKYASVRGNHDAAAVDPQERGFFNADAQKAIEHTADVLTENNMEFLKNLPLVYNTNDTFIGVHASPHEPASWGYIIDGLEAMVAFHSLNRQVAFVGHSHIPCIFTEWGDVRPLHSGDVIKLREEYKYIINVGSVGQPRDGDPKASYIFFDDEDKTVRFFRVKYDWETAARKILDAGLPESLANRILVGL
jgi:predicted phosphodiesterase